MQWSVPETLKTITVLGVTSKPGSVRLGTSSITNFTYDAEVQRLIVAGLDEDLNEGLALTWD